MYVIRAENIPWTATKGEVVNVFANIEILDGKNGIHFILDKDKIHNGAFVQLASKKDFQWALNRQNLHLKHFKIRSNSICHSNACTNFEMTNDNWFYFAVKVANIDAFMEVINHPTYPFNQRVIRLTEVPLKCTGQDICKYFDGNLLLFQTFHTFQVEKISFLVFFFISNIRSIDHRSSFHSRQCKSLYRRGIRYVWNECRHWNGIGECDEEK